MRVRGEPGRTPISMSRRLIIGSPDIPVMVAVDPGDKFSTVIFFISNQINFD